MTAPRTPQPGQPWTGPGGLARVEAVPTFRDAGATVVARYETGQRLELPIADFLDVFDGPVITDRVTPLDARCPFCSTLLRVGRHTGCGIS